MSLSLVAYGDSSDSDLEAEESGRAEKQTSKQDIRKLLSVLPPPKKREKARSKQPVRIGLPKLEEDDSDDDDLPVMKKSRPGGSGGLTAILPQPKGAPASLGGGRRTTTSSMVPYSLTKRKQESKKPAKLRAKALRSKVASEREQNEDSDSDGEPVSFFSLDDSQSRQSDSNSTAAVTSTTSTAATTTTAISHTTSESESTAISHTTSESESTSSQSKDTKVLDPTPSLAPGYQTSGQVTGYQATADPSQWYSNQYASEYAGQCDASVQGYPSTYDQSSQAYVTGYDSSGQGYPRGYASSIQGYPSQHDSNVQGYPSGYDASTQGLVQQPEAATSPQETTPTEQEAPPMPGPGPGLSIDEEIFRRLAGGKRRKGREESLNNLIDINEGDMREGMKTYRKYHTEDSVNKLYTPNPSNAPSGMQKRKHQLTWLAHEAQARELELRNHWGQAAQTRKQTQYKYGF